MESVMSSQLMSINKKFSDITSCIGNRDVVVFGAATVGRVLKRGLDDANIDVKAFCDNNSQLVGKRVEGINVLNFASVQKYFPNAIYLIAVADIQDVVAQLGGEPNIKWVAAGPYLKLLPLVRIDGKSDDFIRYAVDSCIRCHHAFDNTNLVAFRSIELIVTEKCSLKCKDCSNLMQYYQSPENEEMDSLISELTDLFSICDDINEVRIIGGEPFLHKELNLLLNFLNLENKIHNIVIYTNGTIVPRPEVLDSLKSQKVLVLITDYGVLSRRKDPLLEELKQNGINVVDELAQNWTDCGRIHRWNRTEEENNLVFAECCAKNLLTVSAGKLYRCPFSAHLDRLNAAQDLNGDYFEIPKIDENREYSSKFRTSLKEFAFEKKSLKSCDYCNGRKLADEKIIPGIQTKIPLKYIKFSN